MKGSRREAEAPVELDLDREVPSADRNGGHGDGVATDLSRYSGSPMDSRALRAAYAGAKRSWSRRPVRNAMRLTDVAWRMPGPGLARTASLSAHPCWTRA